MKRLIYCVIIVMSISLAFSRGKPCCNKKSSNKTVACKFNQTPKGSDKDAAGELIDATTKENQQSFKLNQSNCSKCDNSCSNTPWWKFWEKKSNCSCKQADSIKAATEG